MAPPSSGRRLHQLSQELDHGWGSRHFRDHQMPVFSISTSIDINGYAEAVEGRGLRFYPTLCCLISRDITSSSCFRHRIVDSVLAEYPQVHPSFNVAMEDGSFPFVDGFYPGVCRDDYVGMRGAVERARRRPIRIFGIAWMVASSSPTFPG